MDPRNYTRRIDPKCFGCRSIVRAVRDGGDKFEQSCRGRIRREGPMSVEAVKKGGTTESFKARKFVVCRPTDVYA